MTVSAAAELPTNHVLMSGHSADQLGLASGISFEPTGGPYGVIVSGIELTDNLSGNRVLLLLSVFDYAGLLILRNQARLTSQRQREVAQGPGRHR